MRLLKGLICVAVLSSCGGGGSGDSSPPPAPPTTPPAVETAPAAGKYSVTSEPASVLSSGDQALYSSRQQMGFGVWNSLGLTLQLMAHPVDDLGNEFPAAKGIAQTKSLTRGVLVLANGSAPDIASISRNWRFANLYRFDNGARFLDYTMQVDLDTAGQLTGFDTNGCRFTGELARRTDAVPLYTARIIATNCGATDRYLENAEYRGHAFIEQDTLVIAVISQGQQLGIRVRLFPQ